MNRKILLSSILSSLLVTNAFSLTLDEKRAAALEALGVKTSKTQVKEETQVKEVVKETQKVAKEEIIKVTNNENKSLEDRIRDLEEKISKDKNNEIEKLKLKISELETKLSNVSSIPGSNTNKLEKSMADLEKKLTEANLPEYKKEIERMSLSLSNLSENSSTDGLEDLEDEISKLKDSSKYQLFKISSLEDSNFDLEDRITLERNSDIQWHGDFKVGYGTNSGQDKAIEYTKNFYTQAVANGTFDPNMVDMMSSMAERKDAFDGEGRLVATQNLTSSLSWLFQLNLTNIAWINVDKSNKEGATRPYMERGYLDLAYDNSLKLRIGADWVKSTIWSDKHFVGETLHSFAPLYNGEIFPTFNIGAEILGIIPVGDKLFDYNFMVGNGDANIMETNTEKLFTGRVRMEWPLFDYTRISLAGGYSTETKDNPSLNDNYNKLMYAVGIEQKINDFTWSGNYVGGQYKAQEDGLEDYTKTSYNILTSYTFNNKITPWIMYDYMDMEKAYGIDLAPIGTPTRDINGQLYTFLLDMYNVETESRIGFGVNYLWNQYFITKLEQYISDVKGNTTLFTFALQF